MNFLEIFHNRTLKYELINKFNYKTIKDLPKLEKIILSFNCKSSDLKNLSINLLALELIAKQKGILTKSKRPNIFLKIRKGHPVGCKVTLRKKQMFKFFEEIITKTFPKLKSFQEFKFNTKIKKNAFSYQIYDTFSFSELEQHYHIFNSISKLDIILVSNSETTIEMLFLLKSLQFPLKANN